MKDQGISLIVADTAEEITAIQEILGISKVSQLKSLEQLIFIDPETVFYSIVSHKADMEKLMGYFNVKRGVMSSNGQRFLVGFNIDWTKRILSKGKPANPPSPPTVEVKEDRESPFEELGYHRR